MSYLKDIEKLREKLEDLIESDEFNKSQILKVSQELDELIDGYKKAM